MVRNVLFLAYYFPPMGLSGVQRVAKFVKFLPQTGWQPYVITTESVAYYAHDHSLLQEVEASNAAIFRVAGNEVNAKLAGKGTISMPKEWKRKLLSKGSNLFFIPDNKTSWAKSALAEARALCKRVHIDVIFVSGPPFSPMLAASTLSKETGIPLVVDYRDLWVGNQFHWYPTPWHLHKHVRLEHSVLRQASRIIVTNRRMKEKMIHRHPLLSFDDVTIIPHGYDPDDIEAVADLKADPSTFSLTYNGIFYDIVTPVPFFKAVAKAQKTILEQTGSPMKLQLNVVGLLRDEYRKKAKKLGLEPYLTNHGYLPHQQSMAVCAQSTALWMMVGNTKNADTISSGKLYEYMGLRKPLLVSVPEGALRKAAVAYGAAWVTDPDDVEAIAHALCAMYDLWKKGALPIPPRKNVEEYDRRTLTQQLSTQLALATRL
jgi:glycosyltransferase involved in cell wall biosynthesis